jgi:hypothetical protein
LVRERRPGYHRGVTTGRFTRAELANGITLESNQRWTIVIVDEVRLTLSWPTEIIRQLPDDLTLTLEGPDGGPVSQPASTAEVADGTTSFLFRWRTTGRPTTLSAKSGDRTLVLWRDQVVDGEEPIGWSAQLEDWLAQPPYLLASLTVGPGEDFVAEAKVRDGRQVGLA